MRQSACLLALALWFAAFGVHALPEEGKPAPAIDVTLLNGGNFSLSAVRGEVVLITFWASWCGPCRQEMPVLDKYYRHYRGEGLRMVAISVDDPFAEDKVRQFMAPYAMPLAMVHDASISNYGRISRIPATFVIDRKGILRKSNWFGQSGLAEADLERLVTPLLRAH